MPFFGSFLMPPAGSIMAYFYVHISLSRWDASGFPYAGFMGLLVICSVWRSTIVYTTKPAISTPLQCYAQDGKQFGYGMRWSYVTDYHKHSKSSRQRDDCHFLKWLDRYDTNILSHTSMNTIVTKDCLNRIIYVCSYSIKHL